MANVKITMPEQRAVGSVAVGNWFVYEGSLYIKLNYWGGDSVHVCDVSSGILKNLKLDTMVTPVNQKNINITVKM